MIFLITLPSSIFASGTGSVEGVGTSMANFLKIGVGARAMGMGGSFVALSDDITATYWNPGGLVTSKKNQVIIQQNSWLVDSNLYFLGGSFMMTPSSMIGVSVNYFGSGDIEETTLSQPNGTGKEFSASDYAIGVTYSQQVTDRFSTGATVKYINESLDSEKASTFAFDVGSVFKTNFFNDMRIGMSLANLGGKMELQGSGLSVQYQANPEANSKITQANLDTEEWEIPLYFRFGVATELIKKADDFRWTVSLEAMDSRDFIHRISSGTEIAFKERYFLRGGYKFNADEQDYAFGAGARFNLSGYKMCINYAYQNFGVLDNVQFFSFVFEY